MEYTVLHHKKSSSSSPKVSSFQQFNGGWRKVTLFLWLLNKWEPEILTDQLQIVQTDIRRDPDIHFVHPNTEGKSFLHFVRPLWVPNNIWLLRAHLVQSKLLCWMYNLLFTPTFSGTWRLNAPWIWRSVMNECSNWTKCFSLRQHCLWFCC